MDFFVSPNIETEPDLTAEATNEEFLEEDTGTYESEMVEDPVMEEYNSLPLWQDVYINCGVIVNVNQHAGKIYYINNVEHLE